MSRPREDSRDAASSLAVSVVMPAYNEEGSIALAIDEVRREVLDRLPRAELVVVDDGSRDDTGPLADECAATDSRVRVIHQANRGHGGALITGMAAAGGEYLLLIDSDRQIALGCFVDAWARIEEGCDGVFGVRRRRYDPYLRLQLTRVVRFSIRALFGVRLYDANVPFKLIRRSVWNGVKVHVPPDTLAPSLFLAIYAYRRGLDIHEMDVVHKERDTGEISIRRLKLLKFCWKGFRQMLAFRGAIRHVG